MKGLFSALQLEKLRVLGIELKNVAVLSVNKYGDKLVSANGRIFVV